MSAPPSSFTNTSNSIPESVHGSFLDYLPEGAGRLVLDIGAGSGRDAAWLRRKGF